MNKKLLSLVIIVALAILAVVNYTKRVELQKQLDQMSVQLNGGDAQQNVEQAKAIVEKVKKHMVIQGDVEPTVATIVDVETLKSKNDFYKVASNGDNLIITPTRAILYSPSSDRILDVVPVQLEPNVPASSASSAMAQ